MAEIKRIPVGAGWVGLPFRGTLILHLLQRVHTDAPAWLWGVAWTLMAFLWLVALIDHFRREHITATQWAKVFGEAPDA